MMPEPSRGDIWLVDLNPGQGHEQSGIRPALVISVDLFNHGPAGLLVVLPITSKNKGIPMHVAINPQEGGLQLKSYIKTEDIRSISKERLLSRLGRVSELIMEEVEDRISILLGL
ncbi:MAG: type II toxin-antitoxin system PemK/MazF family toxin [Firmicutes bacterium]|nr:type II toxin-antitoxin system PemK/MazF family toxin [Bacillota bacterium]